MSKRSCIKSRAIFVYDKNDKKHRYLLERIWDYNKNKGMASVILFNPSNADELKYDRTTMEIINYLIGKNKYNGVFLLNLYSIVELDSKKVIGDNKKIDKDKNPLAVFKNCIFGGGIITLRPSQDHKLCIPNSSLY